MSIIRLIEEADRFAPFGNEGLLLCSDSRRLRIGELNVVEACPVELGGQTFGRQPGLQANARQLSIWQIDDVTQ